MSERRSLVLSGGRVAELPATDVLPGVHRYHGFPQPYQVSLSYSAANRQITITPSGATFDIWVQGVRYVKTGAQVSTAHANSSGNYYIYYAADGTLTTSTDPWDLTTVSPVAYIYYNASLVDALVLFELHTAERNTEWHLSQHYAIGTFVRSGLEISGYTLNSTANTAKTYAIASGIIVDEDIEYDVTGVADGGPYTILYRSGASDWAWTTADSYPFKIGTTYIQYNQNNAGSYQLTELGNNTYMNYWVFATTALSANKQIFIVPSQTYHTSLVNAQAEAITSLSWGGLSLPEIAAIWKITYEAKSSYLTVAGRVQMVEVVRISATRSQISGNFSAGTHNALSGRDFADCHPASAIAYTAHGDLPTETVQFVISSLEDRKQEGGYVLDAFNTLTPAADKVPYFTGTDTAALASLTSAARDLLDDADAATMRETLELASILGQGFRNRLINGQQDNWQRGTTITSTTAPFANTDDTYMADRWYLLSDGDDIVDVSRVATGSTFTTSPWSVGFDVETVNKKFGYAQIVEANNCYGFIGQTATFSFKAKVSSTAKLDNIKAAIVSWSGTSNSVTSDIISAWNVEGTNPTLVANATYENTPVNLNVTTDWAQYSVTAAIDTASTANVILFVWSDVTDTTLGDFLYLTDLQAETGSFATPFEVRSNGTERRLVYRYFQRIALGDVKPICQGFYYSSSFFIGLLPLVTEMRATPSLSYVTGTAYYAVDTNSTSDTLNELSINSQSSSLLVRFDNSTTAAGTAGHGGYLRTNNASAFIGVSAEL